MKKIIAAAALATALAGPAFAQSYDPDLGSGNIAAQVTVPAPRLRLDAGSAYAQVPYGAPVVKRFVGHTGAATDPDPNIRFQLNRESLQGRW